MQTLREALADWDDYDGVLFKLAICLGMIDPAVDFARLGKSVVLGDPQLSPVLLRLLDALHAGGVLLMNDEGLYRWNPATPRIDPGFTRQPDSAGR